MPRIICVGDPNQSLYGFRGAMPDSFRLIGEMLAHNGRPLTRCDLPVNYRCDAAVIREAQKWVPKIKGHKTAWGIVSTIRFAEMMMRANNEGTDIALPDGEDGAVRTLPIEGKGPVTYAILCRTNLPLVLTHYELIMTGKRSRIIGRDSLGAPMKNLVSALCGSPGDEDCCETIADVKTAGGYVANNGLLTRLANYLNIQTQKLTEEGYEKTLEELTQRVECLEVIARKVLDNKVSSVLEEIDKIFTDDPTPGCINLSTIHRSKGLEFDVVFLLRPDLLPHPLAKPNPDGSWSDEQQQEENGQYVCVTRARHRFYYVSDWPFGRTPGALAFEGPVSPAHTDFARPELGEVQDEMFACDWGVGPHNPIMAPPAKPVPPKPPVQKGLFQDDGEPF